MGDNQNDLVRNVINITRMKDNYSVSGTVTNGIRTDYTLKFVKKFKVKPPFDHYLRRIEEGIERAERYVMNTTK